MTSASAGDTGAISRPKAALYGLTLIIATLGTVEALVRFALDPPGLYPVNPKEDPLLMDHPQRGYTLAPGAHADWVTPDVDVDIDIGSDGIRDTTIASTREAAYRILAVGDSYTMGLGVPADATWSQQLERLLSENDGRESVSVVNAGVPGYGAHQMRMMAEELLPDVQPHVVVFGLYVQSFSRVDNPYLLHGGTLIRARAISRVHVTPKGLLYSPLYRPWMRGIDLWFNRHYETGAHLLTLAHKAYGAVRGTVDDDRRDTRPQMTPANARVWLRPVLEELDKANASVAQAGVDFLVLLINPQEPDASFHHRQDILNAAVTAFCDSLGIPVVDPLPDLRAKAGGRPLFRTPSDQHWTTGAHSVAAQRLLPLLERPRSTGTGGPEPTGGLRRMGTSYRDHGRNHEW